MTPQPRRDRDPGSATERTRLAWTRTAVAVTALAVAIAKAAPAVGLPVLAATALAWAVCRRRLRRLTPYGSTWRFPLTTATIVGVCTAAVVAVLLGGRLPH
ncbi:DUF202 domain-containing protein [Actinoallomurus soli]|uniref:DUF202 domain-containing protein n=1 Tax=Actinoallomurus soli TaxID=2952535 RepID=UPI002092A949|nr:DUF202 domain-containing protein [Actinoallomurus soli]MCO5972659.1 DUF202 domain-containing protein [Actinoallomurus soli]